METICEKISERLLEDNMDDRMTKKINMNKKRLKQNSVEQVSELCEYLKKNWDDNDAWLELAGIYEKKQK